MSYVDLRCDPVADTDVDLYHMYASRKPGFTVGQARRIAMAHEKEQK